MTSSNANYQTQATYSDDNSASDPDKLEATPLQVKEKQTEATRSVQHGNSAASRSEPAQSEVEQLLRGARNQNPMEVLDNTMSLLKLMMPEIRPIAEVQDSCASQDNGKDPIDRLCEQVQQNVAASVTRGRQLEEEIEAVEKAQEQSAQPSHAEEVPQECDHCGGTTGMKLCSACQTVR